MDTGTGQLDMGLGAGEILTAEFCASLPLCAPVIVA